MKFLTFYSINSAKTCDVTFFWVGVNKWSRVAAPCLEQDFQEKKPRIGFVMQGYDMILLNDICNCKSHVALLLQN